MSTIKQNAELAYRQLYPNPSDETPITLVEFIETAKTEYANLVWLQNRSDAREIGSNDIPEYLLSTAELQVDEKGRADISKLKVMRGLKGLTWIQGLGDMSCANCDYLIVDTNKYNLLCGDDSVGDRKFAVAAGKYIKFPDGTYESDRIVPIIYATMGSELSDNIEVDDALASSLRRSIIEIYGGKTGQEDKTNNSNPSS